MNQPPDQASPTTPEEVAARLGDAVAHHRAGRLADAERDYRAVLVADPHHPDALHLLGVLALQAGHPGPAVALIEEAIRQAGGVADYHDNLGSALAALNRHAEAADAHRMAAALNPLSAQPRHNLGNAFQAQALPGLAALAFTAAVEIEPGYAKAWFNLGNALRAQNRLDDALHAFARAAVLAPAMVEAHTNLSDALSAAGRLDEALAQARAALRLRPDDPKAHHTLGTALQRKGAYEGAEIAYREALKRAPDNPVTLNDLGGVLLKLGLPAQAERCFRKVLSRNPHAVEAIHNLGNALRAQGQFTKAEACYEEALAHDPNLASASDNLAVIALLHGRLERGWEGYERRFAAGRVLPDRRIDAPRWRGEGLRRRRLMIWREQGIGDEILFASCYGDVIAWGGGPVTIETDPRLVSLFARSFPRATVRAETLDAEGRETVVPPDADLQIPAGSLPGLLRGALDSFDQFAPWLKPDPARTALWRERLDALGPGLKVGIAWRSHLATPEHKAAYTTLDQWGPLFAVPGVVFVNLQYGDCAAEIAAAEARFGVTIHRWDDLDLRDDFEGAAALTANLDLVITPATAAGELAGALGVPVWRFGHRDWTQLGTGVRPWFPTMRLFQPRPGESFDDVLAGMARRLAAMRPAPELAAAPPPPPAPSADPDALLNDAIALHRSGRLDDAMAAYRAILDLVPRHSDALHLLGLTEHQVGHHAQAEAHIAAALRIDPDFPAAWNHLGLVRQALDRPGQALACFGRAIALRPDFPEAMTHMGLSMNGPDRLAEAKRWHRRSIRLAPANPAAHTNLGFACEVEGRFEDAARHYRRALTLRPDSADTLNNLGTLAKMADRPALCRHFLDRALRVAPGLALAAWNVGLLALADGDLVTGWAGYGRRFSARQLQRARRIALPVWNGEPLRGRRLLVWPEQGLGDEILFASVFGDLKDSGGTVVLECDPRLVSIYARAFPWAVVRAESVTADGRERFDPPDCDLQIAAGSLPALRRDRIERFPARPFFLSPDAERAVFWRQRVDALGPGLKVGISWRSQIVTAHREGAYTRITDWLPILEVPGVRVVNLQYGDCSAELASIEPDGVRRVHRWDDLDLKNDLEGVAALMAALDLVILPATAAGELAGALGVPVWRLGGRDWTWMGTGVRPWFPTQRLIAPHTDETSADVVRRIARMLARMAPKPISDGV
ncbi:tetratricopeptide repeat protein (plasmid) [Azospirillum brasilense]|uniref:Tetratricopeptide repeat protein n=1 Tax=Azospirillum brasilense TaxID=192 RepID=A0A4D8R3V7_AZOBR|nr:tetratricopeptide repeat protein [Azospirillum brasilense]QCO16661.1 tetratricopeptide repeat protein [Azospirillum brasilense]